MDQLLQTGASLAAIFALAWLARKLGLGGDKRIRSEEQARLLADEIVSGFDPAEVSIDRAGFGALMRDTRGRILVVRRHGAHFAGRLIERRPDARLDQNLLTIVPDDRHFGPVTLDLGKQAQVWASSLRRLEVR